MSTRNRRTSSWPTSIGTPPMNSSGHRGDGGAAPRQRLQAARPVDRSRRARFLVGKAVMVGVRPRTCSSQPADARRDRQAGVRPSTWLRRLGDEVVVHGSQGEDQIASRWTRPTRRSSAARSRRWSRSIGSTCSTPRRSSASRIDCAGERGDFMECLRRVAAVALTALVAAPATAATEIVVWHAYRAEVKTSGPCRAAPPPRSCRRRRRKAPRGCARACWDAPQL